MSNKTLAIWIIIIAVILTIGVVKARVEEREAKTKQTAEQAAMAKQAEITRKELFPDPPVQTKLTHIDYAKACIDSWADWGIYMLKSGRITTHSENVVLRNMVNERADNCDKDPQAFNEAYYVAPYLSPPPVADTTTDNQGTGK